MTMIDSGSPITIFTKEMVRNIFNSDLVSARQLSKKEDYVDSNGKLFNSLGFITVDVQVGTRNIQKARFAIARDRKGSLSGRDWLAQLNFYVAEVTQSSEYTNTISTIVNKVELSPELRRYQQKLPRIFARKGKLPGHSVKFEFKEGAK